MRTYCMVGCHCEYSVWLRSRQNCHMLIRWTLLLFQSFGKHGRNLFGKNLADQWSDQWTVHWTSSVDKQLDSRLTDCIDWSITQTHNTLSLVDQLITDIINHIHQRSGQDSICELIKVGANLADIQSAQSKHFSSTNVGTHHFSHCAARYFLD